MKKFLSEYGFAILAAIVVILLIMIIGPISNSIQNKIEIIVTSFANKTSIKLGSVENGISEGEQHKVVAGMPEKSDLITIEGAQYRVLSINGTQAKVLATTDEMDMAYDGNQCAYFNGNEGTKYAGSALDNYLENVWYANLPQKMKSAIIPQNITQNMYEDNIRITNGWNDFSNGVTYKWEADYNEFEEEDKQYRDMTLLGSINVGMRHVFALDIQDIYEYFNTKKLTSNEFREIFFDSPNPVNRYNWLRTAWLGCGVAWTMRGDGSAFGSNYTTIAPPYSNTTARPAFVIDLSKIDFQK